MEATKGRDRSHVHVRGELAVPPLLHGDRSPEQEQHLKEQEELLLPIRIDVEQGNLFLRDSFTWNIYGGLGCGSLGGLIHFFPGSRPRRWSIHVPLRYHPLPPFRSTESHISFLSFANMLCDDFKLPSSTFVPLIVKQMKGRSELSFAELIE